MFPQKYYCLKLRNIISQLNHSIYFSDGTANFCHHNYDHNSTAEWHVFATSHGKSPCDGIGGTVMRQLARASLQMIHGSRLIDLEQMLQWATLNITEISFLNMSAVEIKANVETFGLQVRYQLAKSIPGTMIHSFCPLSDHTLSVKRCHVKMMVNRSHYI